MNYFLRTKCGRIRCLSCANNWNGRKMILSIGTKYSTVTIKCSGVKQNQNLEYTIGTKYCRVHEWLFLSVGTKCSRKQVGLGWFFFKTSLTLIGFVQIKTDPIWADLVQLHYLFFVKIDLNQTELTRSGSVRAFTLLVKGVALSVGTEYSRG